MFISVLDLFKIGIGPSSSHTMGPMVAASRFLAEIIQHFAPLTTQYHIRAYLRGSLAFTGHGHATDMATVLGLYGYLPDKLAGIDCQALYTQLLDRDVLPIYPDGGEVRFNPKEDVVFDYGEPLPHHANGMILELLDQDAQVVFTDEYYSIGGGFVKSKAEMEASDAAEADGGNWPYPFATANEMMDMATEANLSIAELKRINERVLMSDAELDEKLDAIWHTMDRCLMQGLEAEGTLPGKLGVKRRAKKIAKTLRRHNTPTDHNDWLCAFAMAVNEQNAAGDCVVTAPTNGAAGVIPAVMKYYQIHYQAEAKDMRNFLLAAAAIGSLIKANSSISGAEMGCQGEVGSASAMAAGGLCQVLGGTPAQIENAAEIALEHHLGMTCDPIAGLVQVPCIERNSFGAIKAVVAASLALHGDGQHIVPLDSCIETMRQTGLDMSHKYKETSLGGLAVNLPEC
ncbi:MAG: L-serine ammonia-lyase [Alphaproteobacteria bacterium]|nr:L-serine ammonia-lyase [Alphaproteobacteria bacterium]